MKKLILFVAVALVMVGCKGDKADEDKKTEETVTGTGNQNVEEKITGFTSADSIASGCDNPIYLDKAVLTDPFLTKYPGLVCSTDDNYVGVDLSEINDTYESSTWLSTVDTHINFLKSYPSIEIWRKVPPRDIAKIPATTYKNISLLEIQKKIKDQKGVYGDHYQKYLNFDISGTSVELTLGQYGMGGNSFSIPLIRSIVANNKLKTNPIFEFGNPTGTNHLIFRVKNRQGNYMYYNFTNNPPTYMCMKML
jgi:hypothetical protein